MRWTIAALLGCLASVFAIPVLADAQITNITTAGNLKPTHDLDCLRLDQVKNIYTPADLMVSHDKCIQAARYEDAMALLLLAGTYSRFDTERVADQTSHDAFPAMQANDPPMLETRQHMQPIIAKYRAPNSPEMAKFCVAIKRIGAPDYYPAYMIDHGMGAVLGKSGGLVADFDARKGWRDALTLYMHCDVSDLK
jgi:hypothetical protein